MVIMAVWAGALSTSIKLRLKMVYIASRLSDIVFVCVHDP